MRKVAPVCLVVVSSLLWACGQSFQDAGPPARVGAPGLVPFVSRTRLERERWYEVATRALAYAPAIELPHAERGLLLAHVPVARAYAFAAVEGQTLKVRFEPQRAGGAAAAPAPGPERRVLADLFLVRAAAGRVGPGAPEYVQVDALEIAGPLLEAPLAESGDYVLRLQPEPGARLAYAMTIELDSALEFPVAGADLSAVRGYFGDPRARGTRRHEGIDIFAERGTAVVAVADGHAVPGHDDLGGIVVRLFTTGTSYYYAHLQSAAGDLPRRVRAGDVLGYVGNSGNARNRRPHLHLSVHPRGREPADPLPRLRASRFEKAPLANATPPPVAATFAVAAAGGETAAAAAARAGAPAFRPVHGAAPLVADALRALGGPAHGGDATLPPASRYDEPRLIRRESASHSSRDTSGYRRAAHAEPRSRIGIPASPRGRVAAAGGPSLGTRLAFDTEFTQ